MHANADPPARTPRIDPRAILPEAAKVIHRLAQHGFDAYLVGGCVRDLLLRVRPKDFDLATSARPRQIKRLFRNSRIIGRRFRLVHIRFGPRILEVATFRAPPPPPASGDDLYIERDNIYGTEKQDAFRRDFTINGLFYDLRRQRVIDHVGGLEDLRTRRLRTIGDARVRLREDPVRILRAARFAGRLDFELTPDLRAAAIEHCRDLRKSAAPRLLEELYRLLSGGGTERAFRILDDLGALEVLVPGVSPPQARFFEALARMEAEGDHTRDGLPQWLMLAVLLSPLALEVLDPLGPPELDALLHRQLQPVATQLSAARRDLARARQCLVLQPRFLLTPSGRIATRFLRREVFADALRLRRVLGPLARVEPDPLPFWEQLAPTAALRREQSGPPRRRRSRRGGRRRRLRRGRHGGKDGECAAPSDSSSAPARSNPRPPSPTTSWTNAWWPASTPSPASPAASGGGAESSRPTRPCS